jgi:hypothetical protein
MIVITSLFAISLADRIFRPGMNGECAKKVGKFCNDEFLSVEYGWFPSPVLHGRVPAPHPRSSFFDEFSVVGSIFILPSRY